MGHVELILCAPQLKTTPCCPSTRGKWRGKKGNAERGCFPKLIGFQVGKFVCLQVFDVIWNNITFSIFAQIVGYYRLREIRTIDPWQMPRAPTDPVIHLLCRNQLPTTLQPEIVVFRKPEARETLYYNKP